MHHRVRLCYLLSHAGYNQPRYPGQATGRRGVRGNRGRVQISFGCETTAIVCVVRGQPNCSIDVRGSQTSDQMNQYSYDVVNTVGITPLLCVSMAVIYLRQISSRVSTVAQHKEFSLQNCGEGEHSTASLARAPGQWLQYHHEGLPF